MRETMRLLGIGIVIFINLLLFCLASTQSSYALPPDTSLGHAEVDGEYEDDWNLEADFFANMYRAGRPTFPLESKLCLRYDCAEGTMYALVLVEPEVAGCIDAHDVTSWIAIDRVNRKVVNQESGNDGTPPDFAWVGAGFDGDPAHALGYEASFLIAPGTTHIIIAHLQVWDDGAEQGSATEGSPGTGPQLIVPACTTAYACCWTDGSCALALPADCSTGGGTWYPVESCEPQPCPQPRYACCLTDGTCLLATEIECAQMQGALYITLSCEPNPCPVPYACCLEDYTCEMKTPEDCDAAGGVFLLYESCASEPCPEPDYACCLPNGDCRLTSEQECAEAGGTLYLETSCDPSPCPEVLFACCLPTGECRVMRETECLEMSGNPEPTDSCEPNPCPPPYYACCLENDETCQMMSEEECFAQGGAWFHDQVCESSGGYFSCPRVRVCCVNEDCRLVSEEACEELGGEWHEESDSCAPPSPCSAPVPADPQTWGGIKSIFR